MSEASTRSSRRRVGAAILVFAFIVASTGPVEAVESSIVSGVVTDLLGQVLSGVELLWVRQPAGSLKPDATALTDASGRFVVRSLMPGKYRVAALKDGYRTFIGQVDTSLQASLNLVLQPAGSQELPIATDDPGWALRVPRRGMLNELDAASGSLSPSAPSPAEPLTVQVEQLFSTASTAPESGSSEVDVKPSETTVELTSVFNDRSSLRLRGQRDQLRAGEGSADEFRAKQSDESVKLEFAYAASPGSELELAASFKQSDYEMSMADGTQPELRQAQQSQAYAARWTRRFDDVSSMVVGLRYLDTEVGRPSALAMRPLGIEDSGRLNRLAGADGTFGTTLGQGHSVSAALHAELFEQPADGFWRTTPDRDGASQQWIVRGELRDVWNFREPWSLILGSGYKQSLVNGRSAMLVPRLGAEYGVEELRVRAVVSYHAVQTAGSDGRASEANSFQPRGRVGYLAEMEFPLATDVILSATTSYEPLQMEYFGYGNSSAMAGDHPLFVTDGNSSHREHRLKLVERRGAARTYFEFVDGECSGTVVPLLPFEPAGGFGQDRVMHFRSGRIGVHLDHIGTDLRLEYQMVDSARRGSGELEPELVQESVEVRLRQDIPTDSWPGFWQLLLALRMGTVRSDELERWSEYAGGETLDALNRRVSGGLSVLF